MTEIKSKLELRDDRPAFLVRKIEEVFQELYDHYRVVESRNEYLRKENARIKDEAYKDEELAEMRKRYEKMSADYYRGFPISQNEDKKIKEWQEKILKEHPGSAGPIGGRFRYEFIPTGVGVIGTVIDSFTKEKYQFQELG